MKTAISLLLIVCLLPSLPAYSAETSQEQSVETNGRVPLEGRPIRIEDEDILMRTLGQERYTSTSLRRFEIVFFISLPVTMWVTYLLMEFVARQHAGPNNPGGRLQTPHYAFMVSSSLLTSFFIAYDDAARYVAPRDEYSGLTLEMPILGLRF